MSSSGRPALGRALRVTTFGSLRHMRHELTDVYATGRDRLIGLGRTLTEADGQIMSTACPAWSVKDIYAHLAGITGDILTGNTEGAATEAWADAQVEARADQSLDQILDQWAQQGPQVTEIMGAFAEQFPFQLFLDQWTHEWDIRSALGARAAAEPVTPEFDLYLEQIADALAARAAEAGLPCVTLDIDGRQFALGVGESSGTLNLSAFELARACMGRRSGAQLAAYQWPVDEPEPYFEALVVWSIAETDIIDPVI